MNVNQKSTGLICDDSEQTEVSPQGVELSSDSNAESVQPHAPLEMPLPPTGYHNLLPIGSGGTSLVYSALCNTTGQAVALKQLRRELVVEQQTVVDFLQEPRILLGLRHPNILRCYDFFFDCETWWIVLEYLTEGSLKTHMSSDVTRNSVRSEHWMLQIADALAYVHSKGLIHGDVKPGNILLDGHRAVLADFGYCSPSNRDPSSTSRICGTVGYMSDDALHGIRSYGNDWYALKKSCEKLGVERIDFGCGKA